MNAHYKDKKGLNTPDLYNEHHNVWKDGLYIETGLFELYVDDHCLELIDILWFAL